MYRRRAERAVQPMCMVLPALLVLLVLQRSVACRWSPLTARPSKRLS